MAQKHKMVSNPDRAQSHTAGSTIQLIQLAEHDRLGTIGYVWPRHWVFHYNAAYDAHVELVQLHDEILQLPIKDNMRLVPAGELLERTYRWGTLLVVSVVLTVQHFVEEIERCIRQILDGTTVEDRLRSAASIADLGSFTDNAGYSGFQELTRIRDAVEHPKAENVYSSDARDWVKVPLAWFMSERPTAAYESYMQWFNKIVDKWTSRLATLDADPVQFEILRGMASARQYRKPPSKATPAD